MSSLFRFKLSAYFRKYWLMVFVIAVLSFMMLCIVSSVKKDRAAKPYPGLGTEVQENPVKKAPEVKEVEYRGATSSIVMAMEYAYMEGQRDYIQGEIKIVEVNGDYKWTKSPWDGGRAAVHNYLSEYIKAFEEFKP